MAAFEFTAVDARGKQHKGLLEGDTAKGIRQVLRERGMTPMSVTEVAEKESSGGFSLSRGFSAGDLALFTRQLATLVRSGLPLEEALAAVSEQTESGRVKRTALGVRARVMEGQTLSSAMGEFPGAFNKLYIATIAAGEHSGGLDNILERLADYVEGRQQMQQKIVLASVYPAILTFVAVAVVIILLATVVPKIVGVFASMDQELPGLTKGLIAVSEFLSTYGAALAVGTVVAIIGWVLLMRNHSFAWRVHRNRLRWPLIGRLVRGINTARFTRTLSILSGSGVPVLDALSISEQVVTNLPMRDAIHDASKRVREGEPVSRSLAQSKLFPPITLHLLASGESSGKLDEMLDRAAQNQEREVETTIAAVMGVFEPLLILTMGGFVLMIVLAILLPIFNLNQLVG